MDVLWLWLAALVAAAGIVLINLPVRDFKMGNHRWGIALSVVCTVTIGFAVYQMFNQTSSALDAWNFIASMQVMDLLDLIWLIGILTPWVMIFIAFMGLVIYTPAAIERDRETIIVQSR